MSDFISNRASVCLSKMGRLRLNSLMEGLEDVGGWKVSCSIDCLILPEAGTIAWVLYLDSWQHWGNVYCQALPSPEITIIIIVTIFGPPVCVRLPVSCGDGAFCSSPRMTRSQV